MTKKFQDIFKKNGLYVGTGFEKGTALFINNGGAQHLTHHKKNKTETPATFFQPFSPKAADFKREYLSVSSYNDLFKDYELGMLMDENPFRACIVMALDNKDFEHFSSIVDIECYKIPEKEKYKLKFYTKRPGILIGRAGHLIDYVRDMVCENNNLEKENLNIDIIEIRNVVYSMKNMYL